MLDTFAQAYSHPLAIKGVRQYKYIVIGNVATQFDKYADVGVMGSEVCNAIIQHHLRGHVVDQGCIAPVRHGCVSSAPHPGHAARGVTAPSMNKSGQEPVRQGMCKLCAAPGPYRRGTGEPVRFRQRGDI